MPTRQGSGRQRWGEPPGSFVRAVATGFVAAERVFVAARSPGCSPTWKPCSENRLAPRSGEDWRQRWSAGDIGPWTSGQVAGRTEALRSWRGVLERRSRIPLAAVHRP